MSRNENAHEPLAGSQASGIVARKADGPDNTAARLSHQQGRTGLDPHALTGHILAFKIHRAATLRGFVDVVLPDIGLHLYGLMIHQKGANKWLGIPSEPQKGRGGNPVLGPSGRPLYKPVLIWKGQSWVALQDRIIAAIASRHPEAFDPEAR